MRDVLTKKELMLLKPRALEKLQNKRLRAAVLYLAPHTPYYARLFKEHNINPKNITCVEDWKKLGLPLVRKTDYLHNPKDFLVTPPPHLAFRVFRKYHSYLDRTLGISLILRALTNNTLLKQDIEQFFLPHMPLFSGGTEYGAPVPTFITKKQKQNLHKTLSIATELLTKFLPRQKPITGMNLFPYGPHLAWHASHTALDMATDLNLCTAAGGAIPTERLVLLAQTFQPTIFTGIAEYFRHRFLALCAQKQITLPQEVLFMHGATLLLDSEKELLRQAAHLAGIRDLTILNLFGASELKEALLPECAPNTGFHHINPLAAILKTVHVNSPTSWEFTEQGALTLWTIDGAGTLLLGYLLGDSAERVETTTCPACHLNTQRFFNITRAKDTEMQLQLTGIIEEKIKGTRINLIHLRERILAVPGIQECQIHVIPTKQKIIVQYASQKNLNTKLQTTLKDLELQPIFQRVALDTLIKQPGLKFKPLIIQ